jgi:hypothetical protein
LEFAKAWYPGLDLAQLATFRQEAGPELAAVGPVLTQHAAAIAEYTDTTVFIPELDEEGAEVLPDWFGLNPRDAGDLAEEIASSDEGEDEEDKDGKDDASDDGADSRPQPDQASTNEPCATAPTAAGGNQAETLQSAAPPSSVAASANPSDPPAAPLA